MATPAIGISYDSHHSSVCLQEPGPSGPILSMITDGYRPFIPVATGADGSWGSAAIIREGSPTTARDGAPDGRFIRALLARIWRHMGGHPSGPVSFGSAGRGPALVVATPAGDHATASGLQQAFADAGAPVRSVISASEAVLAAGAAELHALVQADPTARLVAVVCVGDRASEIVVYRIAEASKASPGLRATPAGPCITLPTGARRWIKRIAEMVIERTTAHGRPLAGVRLLALHDAVLDFCARLRLQGPGIPMPWDGPLHHQAFTDLNFTRRDCTDLPGAWDLQIGLQQALYNSDPYDGERPSLVLVGGAGASFGIVQEACQAVGLDVIDLRQPELAAARGASLWLDFHRDGGAAPRPYALPPPRSHSEPLPADLPSNPIPPWLRD